jgi:hypothetical protein
MPHGDQVQSKICLIQIHLGNQGVGFKQCCGWVGSKLQVAWHVCTIQASIQGWIFQYNKFYREVVAFHKIFFD